MEDSGCLWEWRKENQNSSHTQRTLNQSVICKSKSKDIERKRTSLKSSERQGFKKKKAMKIFQERKETHLQRNKNQIDRFLISNSGC